MRLAPVHPLAGFSESNGTCARSSSLAGKPSDSELRKQHPPHRRSRRGAARRASPDRLAAANTGLEQPHRLEELEAVRLGRAAARLRQDRFAAARWASHDLLPAVARTPRTSRAKLLSVHVECRRSASSILGTKDGHAGAHEVGSSSIVRRISRPRTTVANGLDRAARWCSAPRLLASLDHARRSAGSRHIAARRRSYSAQQSPSAAARPLGGQRHAGSAPGARSAATARCAPCARNARWLGSAGAASC